MKPNANARTSMTLLQVFYKLMIMITLNQKQKTKKRRPKINKPLQTNQNVKATKLMGMVTVMT